MGKISIFWLLVEPGFAKMCDISLESIDSCLFNDVLHAYQMSSFS